ncbi:MAG TPA: DUF885 family protein [Xanthomonadales bacterium]|nr:DUF885 family protein [Xanthomonadales bacterium]
MTTLPRLIGLAACLISSAAIAADTVSDYVDRYLAMFPSRATAAGRYDSDDRLEQLDAASRASWIEYNQSSLTALKLELAGQPESARRIDLELLQRQVQQELLEWRDDDRPRNDPLFWAEPLSQATLYLLLREDRPARDRLTLAARRTEAIPRLVDQALAALAQADPAQVVPEHAAEAASRLRALAGFYRDGLPLAQGASAGLKARLQKSGVLAARAIDKLAIRADELATAGKADFRLGPGYAARFWIVTGIQQPVSDVLAQARRDLTEKRQEAAAYGRGVWAALRPGEAMPLDDAQVLRELFNLLEAERPASTAELVAQYTADTDAAFAFAAEHELLTVPEPRTLVISTAPAWLGGQSVGGVYPAGPFKPDAETLFLLPNIADSAPADAKARFFSAFNNGFNRMIVPHELVPGHYVQLKVAARQPHAVRSLFGDGVYSEGWGSFSERLMLDLGWGGPHERLAHYKKQLENIARLIADIVVHTENWDEPQLAQFLADEALLDAQFAANMWRRAMLTSPQLTTYHQGYRDIHAIWLDWRRLHPDRPLHEFVDGMLALGAVPVREYRAELLP